MPAARPWREIPDVPSVAEKLCRYAEVWTTSDPSSKTFPSTERQRDLGRLLIDELATLGLEAFEDEWGYVTATLPGTTPTVVALVAHLDTSPDAPGENVRPHIVPDYDGSVVDLEGGNLDPARQPMLMDHIGHDLITSDGTTLLGSDDKAGVALAMQLVEDLIALEADAVERGERPAPRPTLRILFTPDEEIGKGTDRLDLEALGADVAYTLDGAGVDVLNVETFNAAEATVTVEGVGVHPGYAKGVMVNATRVAAAFVAALPPDQAPETTDGRAGYLHPHTLESGAERATVRVLLRDFEDAGMDAKRELVRALGAAVEADHPGSRVTVEIAESYRNMRSYVEDVDSRVISHALEAAEAAGIDLEFEPVRGGTDGARLSEKGLPCPNVFTGGHDFHSRFEWNTVQNLERALRFVHALVRRWGAEQPPS
ncbi:peptidase T [Rubrivirga sp.]|uniref:peptidase T n=1 Tax=Rubrivirga sp. TaxID=1885344 RepID=UPI003C747F74